MSKGRQPGMRTRARERVLQALYQVDVSRADGLDALENAWTSDEAPVEKDAREFSERLMRGVLDHREEIDKVIETHSHNWRLERMARVDRNILRLAVFELLHLRDVPKRVVINEAVELAKKFGTEESSAFINGILDKAAGAVRRDEG
ncbi:MAG: transcription antitermination factor NusB [Myxococcales bacterium]